MSLCLVLSIINDPHPELPITFIVSAMMAVSESTSHLPVFGHHLPLLQSLENKVAVET